MKNMNVKFIIIVVCLSLYFMSCSEKSNQSESPSQNSSRPVGIILPAAQNLARIDIAVMLRPPADEKTVAESFSVVLHKVRTECAKELSEYKTDILSIVGISIFEARVTARQNDKETNSAIRCLKKHINGVSVPKFGTTTHAVELQLKVNTEAK